jgi:hypothetical protein
VAAPATPPTLQHDHAPLRVAVAHRRAPWIICRRRRLTTAEQAVFVQQFLPHFLASSYPALGERERGALLSLWPPPPMEASAFDAAQAAFLNDLRYHVTLCSQ